MAGVLNYNIHVCIYTLYNKSNKKNEKSLQTPAMPWIHRLWTTYKLWHSEQSVVATLKTIFLQDNQIFWQQRKTQQEQSHTPEHFSFFVFHRELYFDGGNWWILSFSGTEN